MMKRMSDARIEADANMIVARSYMAVSFRSSVLLFACGGGNSSK